MRAFYMAQCFQRKGFSPTWRGHGIRADFGRQAKGTDERSKEILYNLGSIAEADGNAEEARSFYARVYEVDIGYRDVASKMEQFR